MTSQFLSKLISKNGQRLFYVRARAQMGLPAWYFVFIRPSLLPKFEALPNGSDYDIADYGEVIKSGWGEKAPSGAITEINELYDCDFAN